VSERPRRPTSPSAVSHFTPHRWHGLLTCKLVPGQRPAARVARVYGRARARKVVQAALVDYDDNFRL
jgi:hypothetical protein